MNFFTLIIIFFSCFSFVSVSQETQQTPSQNETDIQTTQDVIRSTVIQEHGVQDSQRRIGVIRDEGPLVEEERVVPEVVEEKRVVPEVVEEKRIITELEVFEEEQEVMVVEEVPLEVEPEPKDISILFVIDNSRSMNHPLRQMDQKFEPFLNTLSEDINIQIGFIDSDVRDSSLFNLEYQGEILDQKILTKEIFEFEQVFLDTLTRNESNPCDFPPYCGSFVEKPLRSLRQFIESEEVQLFNPESIFVVVIVTDNQENSERDRSFAEPESILESFENSPYKFKNVIVYSLSVLHAQCALQIRSQQPIFFREGRPALLADELSEQTGGRTFDLCSESYEDLAFQINSLFDSLRVE